MPSRSQLLREFEADGDRRSARKGELGGHAKDRLRRGGARVCHLLQG